MVYSIDELKKRILPVTNKYKIPAVYLFGSYARNEADDNSDVDIVIDKAGSLVHSLFDMGGLYEELCNSIGKEVDLITLQSLSQKRSLDLTPKFGENVRKDMVSLHE